MNQIQFNKIDELEIIGVCKETIHTTFITIRYFENFQLRHVTYVLSRYIPTSAILDYQLFQAGKQRKTFPISCDIVQFKRLQVWEQLTDQTQSTFGNELPN